MSRPALALVVHCPTCGENRLRYGPSARPTLAPDVQEFLGQECIECRIERLRAEPSSSSSPLAGGRPGGGS